jgi:hypothetical protein
MGYRGKLAERQQARRLRRTCPWPRSPPASASPRAACRCGSARCSSPSSPARPGAAAATPTPSSGASGPRSTGWWRKAEPGIGRLSEREFLVAGVALYAGEGSKGDGTVRFVNSDPRMVVFFCAWLRHFFEIDEARLRLALDLHQGLDLSAAMAYWSGLTGIPESQFTKPYRAAPDPSIRHAKHVHGCVTVSYSCSATHRSIMGLVGALLGGAAIPG